MAATDFLAYSERIAKTDMRILTNTRLEAIEDDGAIVSGKQGEEKLTADTVILALGLKANHQLDDRADRCGQGSLSGRRCGEGR